MRILVVDDNRSSADLIARALAKRGDDVAKVYDGATAIAHLKAHPTDLVITDLSMDPGISGMEVLRAARALRPPSDVIVFTGVGNVETAVQAMQLGAIDFLTKPVSLEQLYARIDELRAPEAAASESREAPLTAESPAGRQLVGTLETLARVPSPVWIEGETGSGRGHAAWTLHRLAHADAPFAVVDPGRSFTWPDRGTVVLSGIDDLPDDAQLDLARRLHTLPEGVRVIATARPDAREQAERGLLRPDLYFKLAVFTVRVPPLRERVQDIVPMFREALARFAKRYHRPEPLVGPDDVRRLEAHRWPGNVRELFNAAERYVVLGSLNLAERGPGPRDAAPVPTAPLTPGGGGAGGGGAGALTPGFSLMDDVDNYERNILLTAIDLTDGSLQAMCTRLGLQPNTLRYKLKKFNLLPPSKPTREHLANGLRVTSGELRAMLAWTRMDEPTLRFWLRRHGLEDGLRS